MSVTESLQRNRYTVVEADAVTGRLRIKDHEGACRDVSCQERTIVLGDDGREVELTALNAGDIVKVESSADRPDRIRVVRRVWEELTSPEF